MTSNFDIIHKPCWRSFKVQTCTMAVDHHHRTKSGWQVHYGLRSLTLAPTPQDKPFSIRGKGPLFSSFSMGFFRPMGVTPSHSASETL